MIKKTTDKFSTIDQMSSELYLYSENATGVSTIWTKVIQPKLLRIIILALGERGKG